MYLSIEYTVNAWNDDMVGCPEAILNVVELGHSLLKLYSVQVALVAL